MRFGSALREAVRELSAPPDARLRILEEVGSDLEDLYAELRAAGVGEVEAKRRAEAMLVPDLNAAADLATVHRPLWMRLRDRYGSATHGAERGVLMVTALLAIVLSVGALISMGLLPHASPFVVVLLVVGGAAMLHAGGKVFRVWGAGESTAERIREGTGALLVAAVGALIAAGFGVIHGLYRVAEAAESTPALESEIVLEWLRTSVVLGVLGLVISMGCGLAWMLFVHRAAVVEMRERAVLGPALRVLGEGEEAEADDTGRRGEQGVRIASNS